MNLLHSAHGITLSLRHGQPRSGRRLRQGARAEVCRTRAVTRSKSCCPRGRVPGRRRSIRERASTSRLRHIEKGKPFLASPGAPDAVRNRLRGATQRNGVLKGGCVRFEVDDTMGLKSRTWAGNQRDVRRVPLKGCRSCSVYFVHGYHASRRRVRRRHDTDYGRPFVSAVWQDKYGDAFHRRRARSGWRSWRILAMYACRVGSGQAGRARELYERAPPG